MPLHNESNIFDRYSHSKQSLGKKYLKRFLVMKNVGTTEYHSAPTITPSVHLSAFMVYEKLVFMSHGLRPT